MSDPVTNVEIEDVLASIRRLVADGETPRIQGLREAQPRRDTLILTPAQRVAEEADQAAGAFAQDDSRPQVVAAPTAGGEGPQGLAARMAARLEAAVVVQDHDWEPDGSEDVPVMDWSAPPPEDAPVFRSRQATPLRLVAAEAPAAEPVAPPAEETVEPSDATFHHRAYASAEDQAQAETALAADLARFESEESLLLADGAAADAVEIDEDLLRRLVAEILRSELEGALGERITRNIRKLVRREIYRALQSGEIE